MIGLTSTDVVMVPDAVLNRIRNHQRLAYSRAKSVLTYMASSLSELGFWTLSALAHEELQGYGDSTMSRRLDTQLRRLIRWYPRSWREEHADVVAATSLEAAETHGQQAVSPGEAWTYRLTGAGMGLDLRVVLATAMLATTVAIVARWR